MLRALTSDPMQRGAWHGKGGAQLLQALCPEVTEVPYLCRCAHVDVRVGVPGALMSSHGYTHVHVGARARA